MRELVSYYVAMEEFCMEANVGKAVEIRDHSADSLTTSMVDDAFFILQKASSTLHQLIPTADRYLDSGSVLRLTLPPRWNRMSLSSCRRSAGAVR